MIRRASVTAVSALAVVLTASGCAIQNGQPPEFTNRPALVSCGKVYLGHGETIPAGARSCMDQAAASSGAELTVTSVTTEGDPIVTYFRVGPKIDGIELFIDGTADSFGPGTWTHQLCRGEATMGGFGGCATK